jgi:hypothetical protein
MLVSIECFKVTLIHFIEFISLNSLIFRSCKPLRMWVGVIFVLPSDFFLTLAVADRYVPFFAPVKIKVQGRKHS